MGNNEHNEEVGSSKLLDSIGSPSDLRKLKKKQLPELAEEIRNEILSAICTTGGHLASSLGVVELTIALHYIFNTPDDRIIWDVGHQTYPHKILTGRRDPFHTIRCQGGLSGFPKRNESPYDSFGTGHASTSISAAMGMAEAIHLSGKQDHVVAVIGDGGLTGGMALEALNQTRKELPNLTVIVNDNEMSIAPSVGQLSTFLSRSMSSKAASSTTKAMRKIAEPLPPWLFDELSGLGRRWRQSFLTFWTPGLLFEGMGYRYIGPVDGHRTDLLLPALQAARDLDEPAIVHVLTKKGKGYLHAEEHPSKFHGIGPFDPDSGNTPPKNDGPPSYTKVFADTLIKLFKKDPRLIGITAAMPQGTGLDKVAKEFPKRVFDMGITEPHCVTFAAGMACEGYTPFVAIYSTFLQRAYDQIVHDVCLQDLPVVFCLDRAGIVGEDGPTHHGLFDISFMRNVPNLTLMAPANENELANMLYTAAKYPNGPVGIRYPRGGGVGVEMDPDFKEVPWGKGEVRIEGKDLVLIGIGNTVTSAERAAQKLLENGVSAAVINARFIKPLDKELILEWADKTGLVVTIEENVLDGGFGSAVLEMINDSELEDISIKRIGINDEFVEQGPPAAIRSENGLDADSIAKTCLKYINDREKHIRSVV